MYVTSESENKQISRHHPQPRWKHAERMAIWSQFCSLEKKYVIRLTYRSFASIMRIVNDEQRRFQTKVIRLNAKYPNGIEAQKEKLEAEGHTIIQKGRKNIRYYVKDYENSLFDLK